MADIFFSMGHHVGDHALLLDDTARCDHAGNLELAAAGSFKPANPNIVWDPRDARSVASLGSVTHIYTFCVGIPEDVMVHFAHLVNASSSIKVTDIFIKPGAGFQS